MRASSWEGGKGSIVASRAEPVKKTDLALWRQELDEMLSSRRDGENVRTVRC